MEHCVFLVKFTLSFLGFCFYLLLRMFKENSAHVFIVALLLFSADLFKEIIFSCKKKTPFAAAAAVLYNNIKLIS